MTLWVGILGLLPLMAQQSAYFYYYKEKIVPLTVDSTRLVVVSEGELSQIPSAYSQGGLNYSIASSSKSQVHKYGASLGKKRTGSSDIYLSTIDVTLQQYDAIKAQLRDGGNVRQVLPSFTHKGKRVDPTDNFYVQLRTADDVSLLQAMAAQYNIEIVDNDVFMPLWYTLSCGASSGMTSIEAANLFHTSGKFASSEPELIYYDIAHSNDTYYDQQWNLKNTGQYGLAGLDINVEGAWEVAKGDGVVVAVCDQGIDLNHPDLAANIYPYSYDAVSGTSPSVLHEKHGTACAGIIGAVQDNGIGISGVAPEVQLMSVSHHENATAKQLANGLNWAWRNGADVISCSWGYNSSYYIEQAICAALDSGRNEKGCVVVFSSGNSGGAVSFPAHSDPRILAVGGINYAGRRMGTDSLGIDYSDHLTTPKISCYGEELDVVAPTLNIYTTDISGSDGYSFDNYYDGFGGTSAACPQVAGVAALMLSANPLLTVERVAEIIESTARKVSPELYMYSNDSIHTSGTWNEEVGYGLVDAAAAVERAAKDLVTTYVKDVVIDDYESYDDICVEMENVTVEDGGYVESFHEKYAILKSIVVKKGGYLLVHPW